LKQESKLWYYLNCKLRIKVNLSLPALAPGEGCSGLAFEDACLDFAEDKDSGVADPVVVFFPGRGGLYWFLFASVDDFADEVLPRRLFCSLQNGICLSAACSLKRRLQCGHCT